MQPALNLFCYSSSQIIATNNAFQGLANLVGLNGGGGGGGLEGVEVHGVEMMSEPYSGTPPIPLPP